MLETVLLRELINIAKMKIVIGKRGSNFPVNLFAAEKWKSRICKIAKFVNITDNNNVSGYGSWGKNNHIKKTDKH